MKSRRRSLLLTLLVVLLAAACVPAAASTPPEDQMNSQVANTPTAAREPPAHSATVPPVPTASPAATPPPPVPASPAAPSPWPTVCPDPICFFPDVLRLDRPIAPPGRDTIDLSYPFGSTQGGQRDPHHGVEFLNSAGTPVLAASDGVVVVAGDERQGRYGRYSYFYGNLVILEHPDLRPGLYTLYGHLSEVGVETGQTVTAGQEIGRVGMSGIATGAHLHFEVRLDGLDYAASRNPELWLSPRTGEDGQLTGALAGRVLDAKGEPLPVDRFVLEWLDSPDGPTRRSFYPHAYEEDGLISQPPYDERFGIGDLPAGWYRLSFARYGMQEHLLEIKPGQLTVVTYRLASAR